MMREFEKFVYSTMESKRVAKTNYTFVKYFIVVLLEQI